MQNLREVHLTLFMKICPHPLPHYPLRIDHSPQLVTTENPPHQAVLRILIISRTVASIISLVRPLRSTLLILNLLAVITKLRPLGAPFYTAMPQSLTQGPLTLCIPRICPTTNSIDLLLPSTPKKNPHPLCPLMIVTIAPMSPNPTIGHTSPPATTMTDRDKAGVNWTQQTTNTGQVLSPT